MWLCIRCSQAIYLEAVSLKTVDLSKIITRIKDSFINSSHTQVNTLTTDLEDKSTRLDQEERSRKMAESNVEVSVCDGARFKYKLMGVMVYF